LGRREGGLRRRISSSWYRWGEQPADAEFYVVPVGVLYDWAEDRHRAYWARRGEVTGESGLVQIRDTDADVREFLDPYRDAWERVTGARKA
jgi:hypothetical protein